MTSLNTAESRVNDLHNKLRTEYLKNMEGLKKLLTPELVKYFQKYNEFMIPSPPEGEGLNQVASFVHNRNELQHKVDIIGPHNIKVKELYSMYMEALEQAKMELEKKGNE